MNPNNINAFYKRNMINQNIFHSAYGMYKSLPTGRCSKNIYTSKYQPGIINKICDVKVINKNPIDILDALLEKGPQHLVGPNKPLVLQSIGDTFTQSRIGSGEGLRDQLFVLRTNFSNVCKINDPFPLKNNECAYIPLVTVIRDNTGNFVQYDKLFTYSLILAVPVCSPDKIDDDKMNIKDYMTTLVKLETVFQTAIACGHTIFIITPFGLENVDNNPVEDLIKILNYCIFKYGHKFDNIILSVPEYFPENIYTLFSDNLVNPQELTKEVDIKYEASKLHAKLLTK
jgi:hypothetical protein